MSVRFFSNKLNAKLMVFITTKGYIEDERNMNLKLKIIQKIKKCDTSTVSRVQRCVMFYGLFLMFFLS